MEIKIKKVVTTKYEVYETSENQKRLIATFYNKEDLVNFDVSRKLLDQFVEGEIICK